MKAEGYEKYCAAVGITVVEIMKKLDETAKGIVFITGEDGSLVGSVSDGDIRRWLIRTGDLAGRTASFMNDHPKFLRVSNRDQAGSFMQHYSIRAVPILDDRNRIVEILFDRDVLSETVKKEKEDLSQIAVVIMAGGKGTRLYPYTKILPKPLIPIGDIPIIERIIDRFRAYGISDFYMTVNYKKSMIKSYFSDLNPDYSVYYVEEDKPLGTAGGIRLIKDSFHCPIIVTNCDILIDADYANILKYHKEAGNALTVVSALKNMTVPYGVLHSREDGIITSMEEKPSLTYFVNTGMYVMEPDMIHKIPEDEFFHMTNLADLLMREGMQVGMYPISEESFLDMGEFEEMHRMEEKLNQKVE